MHTAAIEELQASKATIEAQRKEIAQLKQQQQLRGQVLGANL